jgi:predicted ABC-type ATPase
MPALSLAYRAYIFDNSGREAILLAEKTPRGNLNLAQEQVPAWFEQHVLKKLATSASN